MFYYRLTADQFSETSSPGRRRSKKEVRNAILHYLNAIIGESLLELI